MVEISRTTFQAAQLRAKTFWIFVRATATPAKLRRKGNGRLPGKSLHEHPFAGPARPEDREGVCFAIDTIATLEKLIAVYVEQHNSVVPHSAFAGQTPDEMYFGRGDQVPVDLAVGRARAREARLKFNRELSCEACRSAIQEMPGPLVSSAISGVLQMHDEMSAMS
jgi:hypothetical protein